MWLDRCRVARTSLDSTCPCTSRASREVSWCMCGRWIKSDRFRRRANSCVCGITGTAGWIRSYGQRRRVASRVLPYYCDAQRAQDWACSSECMRSCITRLGVGVLPCKYTPVEMPRCDPGPSCQACNDVSDIRCSDPCIVYANTIRSLCNTTNRYPAALRIPDG